MYHTSILTGHQDEDDFGERLGDIADVAYCPVSDDEEQLVDELKDADIIICKHEKITASLLEKLDELKLIVILRSRFDNVDVQAAAQRGVKVLRNADYCTDDIADHTCAMILALIRQIPEYQDDIRRHSRWQFGSVKWELHRVSSHLIGLVGFGRSGRAVAARMQAFGCTVQAYDPFVEEEVMLERNVKPVDFDKLMRTSDIISLHVPLNETTRYLFRDEQFDEMKEGSMFVNCSRGGLVDEAALYHAVDDGHVRSAALDVLSMEHPGPMMLKMMTRQEFLLTPSIASHSVEAEKQLHDDAERYIRAFVAGETENLPFIPASGV